ncbi:MAG: hypothetical protein MI717_10595, partial [Spirochaetales bacterium]|nr:hypothetical protein [Spirochaetales bacterium]
MDPLVTIHSKINEKKVQTHLQGESGSNKRMSLLVTANIFISEFPETLDQILPVQLNFAENHQYYILHQTT